MTCTFEPAQFLRSQWSALGERSTAYTVGRRHLVGDRRARAHPNQRTGRRRPDGGWPAVLAERHPPATRSPVSARTRPVPPLPRRSGTRRCQRGAGAAPAPTGGSTSSANRTAVSASTVSTAASRVRGTPRAAASSCSASARAAGTPADESVSTATVSKVRGGGHRHWFSAKQGRGIGLSQGIDDVIKGTVEDLVEVVGLEPHPMIADPVLRKVVGTHSLRAIDGADLRPAGVGRGGIGLAPGPLPAAELAAPAGPPPDSAAGSSRSASTPRVPVGR